LPKKPRNNHCHNPSLKGAACRSFRIFVTGLFFARVRVLVRRIRTAQPALAECFVKNHNALAFFAQKLIFLSAISRQVLAPVPPLGSSVRAPPTAPAFAAKSAQVPSGRGALPRISSVH
jgi:hypothetical protein